MKAEALWKSKDIQDFKTDFKTDLFVTGRVQTATNEQLRKQLRVSKETKFPLINLINKHL
jgi:hypothetical protein